MKVTPREKKVIALAAVIAAVVMVYFAVDKLLPDGEDLSQTVELKKKMLLKQRETLGREETYKQRLEQYTEHLQQDLTKLLPGDSPNVASAELQKILKEFADQSSVEITQRNTLPAKKAENGIQRVSVRIETNCTPEELVHFLAAIENHEKFLTVDEFTITGFRNQRRYDIRPSLTISGYIHAEEKEPEKKAETGA